MRIKRKSAFFALMLLGGAAAWLPTIFANTTSPNAGPVGIPCTGKACGDSLCGLTWWLNPILCSSGTAGCVNSGSSGTTQYQLAGYCTGLGPPPACACVMTNPPRIWPIGNPTKTTNPGGDSFVKVRQHALPATQLASAR
jgi:hypothetical protein